jgi:hypothetical protein
MLLHCRFGATEDATDFAIAFSFGHPVQDFVLANSERRGPGQLGVLSLIQPIRSIDLYGFWLAKFGKKKGCGRFRSRSPIFAENSSVCAQTET